MAGEYKQMSETIDSNDQIPFVRWLHAQAVSDQPRLMPYSAIYNWGREIHVLIGPDGKFDSQYIALELAKKDATAEDLAALTAAEAAWRVDTLIESAEIAGVLLDVGQTEVVPESMLSEIEASEAIVLCGYRNHRGEGCTDRAVAGAGRCGRHGGAITDPEVRRSFLLVAFAKVIDGSRVAVDALLDVAENGRSEMARVQAAKELLDRAGVQQDQHVHIHRPEEDTSKDDLVDELRRRLSTAADRLRITAVPVDYEDTTFEFSSLALMPVVVAEDDNEDDRDVEDVTDAIIVDMPKEN
jgi:hypothetical protein